MTVVLQLRPTPEGPETPLLNELNLQQRAFVLHLLLGSDDVRGKVFKSYVAAGYTGKNDNSISAAASQLRNSPKIKAVIEEVQKEIEREYKSRMMSWIGMGVKAQMVLDKAVDSMLLDPKDATTHRTYLTANQIAVIREVLDRALGRPTQPHTHDVGEKLDNIIQRLAAARKGMALPAPSPVDNCVADIPAPMQEISANLTASDIPRIIIDDDDSGDRDD